MQKKALVFDIGGTKIESAVITSDGQILETFKIRTPASSWGEGKRAIVELGKKFLTSHQTIQVCGLSAAGPLHAPSGMLLHPTNMNWGEVAITEELSSALGIDVILENDAAAAVMAEHWRGDFANVPDLITVTLGTGLGVGVVIGHQLLRGGHDGMHPEIGHLMLDAGDADATCNCGNLGCAEAYLAGSHFLSRARRVLHEPGIRITQIIERAQKGEEILLQLFDRYAWRMAQFITNLVVSYYPERVILAGSFAKASFLFLPQTEVYLRQFLQKRIQATPSLWPKISVSSLHNPGLWGAARIAFQKTPVKMAAHQ